MNRAGQFIMVSLGGLVGLMILGMIISLVMEATPSQVREINLIEKWFWYRCAFYACVIACWTQISIYMTRPPRMSFGGSEEDARRIEARREKDRDLVKAQRWKVALLFVFFEVVIIQQFGLAS